MATVPINPETLGRLLAGPGVVLLDFWAPWCRPCHYFKPVFEAASERHPDLVFGSVDTDEQQGLAARFHVASLPTLVILRDGEIVYSRAGVARLTELEALIDTVTAGR